MIDQKFTMKVLEEKPGYSKIEIEPLVQGYGHTLGNALRRVMLSSLTGAAVTSIKVKGVKHQFSTLEGMSEDIVELVLNLKSLRVRLDKDAKVTLKLEAKGPGVVTAADIHAPVGVTIGNPELEIAHLSDKSNTLEVEMVVEKGTGYSLAEERKSDVVGEIPVDALFSPIKRVNPIVSATRVGRRTDFDRLVMEIWTDNTITGNEALEQAAQILVDHFNQIINPVLKSEEVKEEEESDYPNEVMRLTVEELDLPTRIANALRKGGFKTVSDLTKSDREDIVKVKNLGERSVALVEEALQAKGVKIGEQLEE